MRCARSAEGIYATTIKKRRLLGDCVHHGDQLVVLQLVKCGQSVAVRVYMIVQYHLGTPINRTHDMSSTDAYGITRKPLLGQPS